MYYLRRVSPDKWDGLPTDDSISLSDLNTSDHDISVWKVADDKSNLDQVILACAMANSKVKDFSYVLIDERDIEKLSLNVNDKLGRTMYVQMRGQHINIETNTGKELCALSVCIHDEYNNSCKDVTITEIRDCLYRAVKEHRAFSLEFFDEEDSKNWKQALLTVCQQNKDTNLLNLLNHRVERTNNEEKDH